MQITIQAAIAAATGSPEYRLQERARTGATEGDQLPLGGHHEDASCKVAGFDSRLLQFFSQNFVSAALDMNRKLIQTLSITSLACG